MSRPAVPVAGSIHFIMDFRAAAVSAQKLSWHAMVCGMATAKITITLEEDQAGEIRELIAAGQTSSVSAFVKHAVSAALFDAAGWSAMVEDALRQTGGPLTKKEREWADAILSTRRTQGKFQKGKAARPASLLTPPV
jgi:Arc/MetJ-type ribon-helix-helix transcriptional regulator